jgi:hypothetical protein
VGKLKILFLAASPDTAPLRLDEEVREVTAKIRSAEHRDALEVVSRWAVRPDDLQQALLEHEPHVLHFSGHGSKSAEIILLDGSRQPKPVSQAALVTLLRTLKDNLRVVVLNACFSRPQAEAITQVIDCAIGMKNAIGDEAAIKFAASFYRGLGFGKSVKTSFDLGTSTLMLEGIPEEGTPELITRTGIDASRVFLVESSPPENDQARMRRADSPPQTTADKTDAGQTHRKNLPTSECVEDVEQTRAAYIEELTKHARQRIAEAASQWLKGE